MAGGVNGDTISAGLNRVLGRGMAGAAGGFDVRKTRPLVLSVVLSVRHACTFAQNI